tara:strand:- start:209 stop:664 length:456 start_codon:yes stop_codon:yes gene_type:complete
MIEEKYLMETHWNNHKEEYTTEAIVLAAHLDVHEADAESAIDDQEYSVLTDEQADEAVREYIEETVWAFSPSFLSTHTGVDAEIFVELADKCEGINEPLKRMIKNFDEFVEDAIACDGRGLFLAAYDHIEHEVTYKSIDNIVTTYYIYRRN